MNGRHTPKLVWARPARTSRPRTVWHLTVDGAPPVCNSPEFCERNGLRRLDWPPMAQWRAWRPRFYFREHPAWPTACPYCRGEWNRWLDQGAA